MIKEKLRSLRIQKAKLDKNLDVSKQLKYPCPDELLLKDNLLPPPKMLPFSMGVKGVPTELIPVSYLLYYIDIVYILFILKCVLYI